MLVIQLVAGLRDQLLFTNWETGGQISIMLVILIAWALFGNKV